MNKPDKNVFKSILCLNGNLPTQRIFKQFSNLPIITADGAGDALLSRGIKPNYIVGDFDSSKEKSSDYKDIHFIKYENQNYNDFEKCILVMRKNNLFPALVFGIFGKEVDHMMNNINCLMKHNHKCPMIFYNEEALEKPQWGTPIDSSLSFNGIKGELLSIIPHPTATISSKGLKWELSNQKLSINGKSGIRNEALGTEIKIQIHHGKAIIITNRQIGIIG